MIVRTDAVVLRTLDYSETSRIATLLTRSHGVVGALARGARRPTSTFGSTLQPMSAVQVVFYHRPGRGLQTLKEASHIVRWKTLTQDFHRVPLGLRAVEVARGVLGEGEAHPLALDLLIRTLAVLDAAEDAGQRRAVVPAAPREPARLRAGHPARRRPRARGLRDAAARVRRRRAARRGGRRGLHGPAQLRRRRPGVAGRPAGLRHPRPDRRRDGHADDARRGPRAARPKRSWTPTCGRTRTARSARRYGRSRTRSTPASPGTVPSRMSECRLGTGSGLPQIGEYVG